MSEYPRKKTQLEADYSGAMVLLEQNEKLTAENAALRAEVEKLKAFNKHFGVATKYHCGDVLLENDRLLEVVRFYADLKNWNTTTGHCTAMRPRGLEQHLWAVLDMGETARDCLSDIETAVSSIKGDGT